MARIDIYVERIPFEKDWFLIMESDNPPILVSKDGKKNVTNQLLGMIFIVDLLYEILPRDLKIPFGKPKGEFKFIYQMAADKPFKVAILKNNARIRVSFVPQVHEVAEKEIVLKVAEEGIKVPGMDVLLEELCNIQGSDLHLSVDFPPVVRVNGEMRNLGEYLRIQKDEMEQLILSIMPERFVEEFKNTNDVDFAYELEGKGRF